MTRLLVWRGAGALPHHTGCRGRRVRRSHGAPGFVRLESGWHWHGRPAPLRSARCQGCARTSTDFAISSDGLDGWRFAGPPSTAAHVSPDAARRSSTNLRKPIPVRCPGIAALRPRRPGGGIPGPPAPAEQGRFRRIQPGFRRPVLGAMGHDRCTGKRVKVSGSFQASPPGAPSH